MKTISYTPRCAWFAVAMLCAGLAVAQDGARRAPEVRILDIEQFVEEDAVRVRFEPSLRGIGLAIASDRSLTQRVLPTLPPILADIQAAGFFLLKRNTEVRLGRWVRDYFAQFVVLEDAMDLLSASLVLTVPASAPDVDAMPGPKADTDADMADTDAAKR